MAEEIERYRAKVNFQHKFEGNVLAIRSPKFFVRNIPFLVDLYRTGGNQVLCDLVCQKGGKGFSMKVDYKLSLVLVTSSKTVQSAEFSHTFTSSYPSNAQRRTLSEILSGEKVVLDDFITLGVSLWAYEPEGIDFKPPKEKLRQGLQIEENKVQNNAFASLLDSGDHSDVTFVVNEDSSTVKAHKTILIARSSFFYKMLMPNSGVTDKVEEIRIDDMGATAFRLMLRYIYTGLLRFPKGFKVDLKICQELVKAGEKYGLRNLKEYAAMAMTEFVSLENAWELFSFATQIKAEAATKALGMYYGENLYKIKEKV